MILWFCNDRSETNDIIKYNLNFRLVNQYSILELRAATTATVAGAADALPALASTLRALASMSSANPELVDGRSMKGASDSIEASTKHTAMTASRRVATLRYMRRACACVRRMSDSSIRIVVLAALRPLARILPRYSAGGVVPTQYRIDGPGTPPTVQTNPKEIPR